ncbi:MAG: phage tail tape measure protein, partial [Chloroflexi bacterium CFX6]|nr:phage tail tape measure protein [Chloroflexi bacterium CFX6]
MSDDIGQIRGTVVVGSDLKGLDSAEAAFKDLERAAAQAESQLGDLAIDVDLSSLNGARAAIEDVSSAAAGLGDGLSGASLEIDTSSLEGAAAAIDDTAVAAEGVVDDLASVGDAAADAGAGMSRLDDGGAKAAAGLGQLSDRTVKVATAITAVTAAIGVATAQAAEYQQAVTLISTLSSDTAARFDEYKTGILEVSQALGQDAVAGAKAAYDALSSGVSADAAVGFLESASKAATAGVTSVDVAGKALTVTLNSYNLKASETTAVSDAMFAAANVGVTTFDELAASFGGVAGIAASSGASYQETLGALAQITTKGISTSDAVTQLKNTFVALSKPNALVAEALQAQGFASAEAAIKAKGLQHVMETIRQVSTDTGKPLIELVGSVEAVNAILATTGDNAAASREKMAALASSAGATQAAFDLISETPAQRMAVFRSSVQAATISLGDAFLPVLGALLDAVTPLVQGLTSLIQGVLVPLGEAFSGMPEPIRLTAAALTALVAGGAAVVTAYASAGPVMSLFAGGAASAGAASGAAAGGIGLLQTAATSLMATFSAAALPLTAIVAVLGTLAFASQAANDALEEQYAALDKSSAGWDEYSQAAQRAREESGILASIGFGLNDTLSEMGDELTILGDEISSGLSSAWSSISSGASSAMSSLRSAFGIAEESAGRLKVSTGAAIDAGEAFLKYGTNIQASVLESDAFGSAQARLNESLRAGKLTHAE